MYPGTFSWWKAGTSTWSTSMSEIAVLSAVLQFTSRCARYTLPPACSLRKAALTALVSWSSMVKAWRDQSGDAPTRRSWAQILLPYFSTHSCTASTKASRPMSWRDIPFSRASVFSTTVCVAMPAWSVPGTHSVVRPRIRFQRTTASSMAAMRAWPRCREPVTLGGGMTMTKGGSAHPGAGSAGAKYPHASHQAYVAASTYFGSYTLGASPP